MKGETIRRKVIKDKNNPKKGDKKKYYMN